MLLLDEPSAGLDRLETRQFGAVLEQVVEDRGIGVLLVEHDMSLVVAVCNYIYVLDHGELLFDGTPEEVAANPLVRDAYVYLNRAPGRPLDPNVKEFMRFILSREGQEMIAKEGTYLPLSAKMSRAELQKLD